MPLVIYQVGDVPIFHKLQGVDNSGVKVDLSRKWLSSNTKVVGANGSVLSTDPSRAVSDASSLSISGTLIFENGDNPQTIVNRLHSFAGLPNIPVVAFYYQEPIDVSVLAESNVNLIWLYTNGLIEDSKISSEYLSDSDIHNFTKAQVDLTIKVNYMWRALDRMDWEYRRERVRNPLEDVQGGSAIALLPSNPSHILNNHFFYRWADSLDIYDAELWAERFDKGEKGGVGTDFTNNPLFTFYVDPDLWNAPPVSIYAFTNLGTTGSIQIQTERPLLHFMGKDSVVNTATLNLAQLNTSLASAGLIGLQNTDVIITGAALPFPGFVMRYNESNSDYNVITSLRPEWLYTGSYPGETGLGQNIVTVTLPSATNRVAQLHSFGVY